MRFVIFCHSLISDWNHGTCAQRVDELLHIIHQLSPRQEALFAS